MKTNVNSAIFRVIHSVAVACFFPAALFCGCQAQRAGADKDYYFTDKVHPTTRLEVWTNVNNMGVVALSEKYQLNGKWVRQVFLTDTGRITGKPSNPSIGWNYLPVCINDLNWVAAGDPGIDGGMFSLGKSYVWLPKSSGNLTKSWNALSTLGGTTGIFGFPRLSMNNHGAIVGQSQDANGALREFLWTPGGTGGPQITDIGPARADGGQSINDSGQIVGGMREDKPVMYNAQTGNWETLPFAPAFPDLESMGYSWATQINNFGEVVGNSNYSGGNSYSQKFLNLPKPKYGLPAGTYLLGDSWYDPDDIHINDYGHIAGYNNTPVALGGQLWVNGTAYPLSPLIAPDSTGVHFEVNRPSSINNRGQILTTGNFGGNLNDLWLLTPKFKITGLTYDKPVASAGDTVTATINLNMKAPFDILVNMTNPNPMAVTNGTDSGWDPKAPTTFQVTIPAGVANWPFLLKCLPVTKSTIIKLDAEFYQVHAVGALTVQPQALPPGTPKLAINNLQLTNVLVVGELTPAPSISSYLNVTGDLSWSTSAPANTILDYGPTVAYGHSHQRGEITTDKLFVLDPIDQAKSVFVLVKAVDIYGRSVTLKKELPLPGIVQVTLNATPRQFDVTKGQFVSHVVATFKNAGGKAATNIRLTYDYIPQDVGKVDPNQLFIASLASGESTDRVLMNRDDPADPLDFDSGIYDPLITFDQGQWYNVSLKGDYDGTASSWAQYYVFYVNAKP